MYAHTLLEKTCTLGQQVKEPLNAVQLFGPDGKINLLYGIGVFITGVIAQALTSDAIAQDRYPNLITRLQFYDLLDNELFKGGPQRLTAMREMCRLVKRSGPADPTAALGADGNASAAVTYNAFVPFYFDRLLDQPEDVLFPAAFLKQVEFTWTLGTATQWGTGDTVTAASTSVRIVAFYMPHDDVKSGPVAEYRRFNLASLSQEALAIRGKVLAMAAIDEAGGATTTFGSTDFTHIEMRGGSIATREEDVDTVAEAYNAQIGGCGDASDAALALPTSGSARQIPMVVCPDRSKLSQLPEVPEDLIVTFTAGAGAPTASEQVVNAIIIKPPRHRRFASLMERASRKFPQATVLQAIEASEPGGRKGPVARGTPMAKWAPRKVSANVLARGRRG